MPWPDICVEESAECPNKWPVLFYQQATKGCQTVCIKDREGCAYDLTGLSVDLYVADVPGTNARTGAAGTVVDAVEGKVEFCFLAEHLKCPGLYRAEIQVYTGHTDSGSSSSSADTHEHVICYRAPAFVEVQAALTESFGDLYPISVAEVRLAIRDKCSLDNFLLDNVQFTDTEIAWAIRRPIEWWNETPPDICKYSPVTFPYRYNHLNAIIGELLIMVAGMNEERNRLTYSAGGVSVNDKDHANSYIQIGRQLQAEFKAWGLGKKKTLNMDMAYGTTNIPSFGSSVRAYNFYEI